MEPSLSSTAPDLNPGNGGRGPDGRLGARSAGLRVANIDTHFATRSSSTKPHQLSSPPNSTNSTSSPSPSPSFDTAQQPISPSTSSTATTPLQRGAFSISDTAVSDLLREQFNGRNCSTPSHRPSNSLSELSLRLSMSDSSISQATLLEANKRKATGSPGLRPRALTQGRPHSMMFPLHRQRSQLTRDDNLSKASEQHQNMSTVRFLTVESQQSGRDGFWKEDPDDPDPQSVKRPKADLRGAEGRKARQAVWAHHQKPSLRRRSTNSMIAGLNLTCDDDPGENTPQRGTNEIDTVMTDVEDMGPEQIPVVEKTRTTKRPPLMDISASISYAGDIVAEPALNVPLTPLMTRQPKKVSPFPVNPSYWSEYANDTLNHLLEIEDRYDRYMYLSSLSEHPEHRKNVVLWLMELCYNNLDYAPSVLHHGVSLLDRFLSMHTADPSLFERLNCIGICSVIIASKLEEESSSRLNVSDLCIVCNISHLFTLNELTKTELAILADLKFEIMVSSASCFSDYYKQAVPANPQMLQLVDPDIPPVLGL
ncbi:hypothetical protein BGX31_010791 [Mortierella sp. GBA43]|nr:hypothetical protein BGX31_010791 [Mortierella sp. GBA43]